MLITAIELMDTPDYDYCLEVLETYTDIPPTEWRRLRSAMTPARLEADEFFVRSGTLPQRLAFIVSGVFRVFCITSSGVERTLAFRKEGDFLAALSPLVRKQDCWYSIQAIEASELLCIDLNEIGKVDQLLSSNSIWNQIFSKYLMELFIEKEERERSFLTDDAQRRYLSFIENHPDLERRLPDFTIASYLGISHVSLSRIRGKMRKN